MTSGRRLATFVAEELAAFRAAGDSSAAWIALERAHILSQPGAWLHTKVHAHMLLFAVRQRDWPEVTGQIVRIAVAALGTALNRAPIGNTGRANVPIMAPMPIPPDLSAKLEAARQ